MVRFLKLKLNWYTNIYKVSIGIILVFFFCCTGFSLEQSPTVWKILPESGRIFVNNNMYAKDVFMLSNGGEQSHITLPGAFVQAAENKEDVFPRQQFLTDSPDLSTPTPTYNYSLATSADGSCTYFSVGSYPRDDQATISRDGNKLLIANTDTIKVYSIDKVNKCLSKDPFYTYTATPGKVIIPESVSINGGNCINFKEWDKGNGDIPDTLRKPSFISDDGYRKLVSADQNDPLMKQLPTLSLWGGNGWGKGITVPLPKGVEQNQIKQFSHSNNLQYFILYWENSSVDLHNFYQCYLCNTGKSELDPDPDHYGEFTIDGFPFVGITNDETVLKWCYNPTSK